MFNWLRSPSRLEARAEIAAKQMRYFRAFTQNAPFSELAHSAVRAGFVSVHRDDFRKEASFRWAEGEPDFIFCVSFEDRAAISVIAESYGDIFGLVMISHSNLPNISVEVQSALARHEFGARARQFRKILLSFPDFDGGTEEILSRFK